MFTGIAVPAHLSDDFYFEDIHSEKLHSCSDFVLRHGKISNKRFCFLME